MFLNFSSVFLLWLLMELNMVVFIMLFYLGSSTVMLSSFAESLTYFLFQSLGTFMFLICCLLEPSYFLSFNYFLMLAVAMKMGVPPFHGWVLKLSSFLSNVQFFVLLGPQKIPMLMVFFMWEGWVVYSFLILVSFFSCFFLFNSPTLKDMLIFSSFCSLIWFYLSLNMSHYFFFIFYSMYMFALGILLYEISVLTLMLYSLNSAGVPPAGFFFMKMYLILEFFESTYFIFNVMIWSISFMSLLGYFKFFWIFLHLKQKIFSNFSYLMSKKFFALPFLFYGGLLIFS